MNQQAVGPETAAPDGISPGFLAYVVGPVALVLLLVLRHFGLVAKVPAWAYGGVIVASLLSSRLVERWPDAPPGSLRLHVRVAAHVTAVTSVIYLLLAYPVIYIRELRHFLPLAIVVLPLAVRELERRADHLSDSSTSATATNTNTNG